MSGSDLETDLSDDLLDDFGLDDDIDALSSFDDPPSPAVHESPVTAGGLSLFPEPSDNARRRSSAAVDPEDLLATKPAADSISPFGNLLAASSNAGFGNIFAQLASPRPKDLSPTDPAVEVPSVVLNDALEAPVPDNAEDAGTDPAPSDDKSLPPLQDLRSQHDHFMLAAAKVLAACGHAAHLCDVADFTLPAGAPTVSDEEDGPTTEEGLSEVLRGAQRAADRVKALCRDDVDLTARWFTLICSKAPAAAEGPGPMDGVSLDGSIHTEPEEDEAAADAGTSVIPAEESLATAVAVTRQALLCAPTADEQAAVAMRGSLQRTVPVEGTDAEQAAIAFCLKVRAVAGQLAGLAVELCFVCAQSTIVPVAFVDGRDGPAPDDDPTELHLPRPAFLPALEHVATLGLQMPAFFALRLAVLVHPPDAVEAVCRPILLRSAAYSHSNVEAALMAVAEQALTDGLRDPVRWVAPMVHAFAALLDTCTELLHAEIDRVERARSELAKGRSLRSASAKAMEVKVPKTVDLVDLILDVLTHIVSRGAGKAFLRGTLVSPPTSARSSDTAAPKRDIAATLFAGGVDESRDRPLGATTEAGGLDVCLRGLHMLRLKRRLQLLGAGSEAATRALMSPGSRQSGADGHAGPGEEQATATVQRLLKLVTPTFLFGAALDDAEPEPDLADSTRPPPSPLGDSNVELVISDSSAGPLGTGSVQGEGGEKDEKGDKDEREGEGTGTGESEAPFSDPDGPKEVGLAALRKDSEKSEAAVTITTPDDRRISQPFASTRSSVSEAPLTPQAQRLQRLSRLLGADDATTLLRLVNDALVYFVLDDAQECARLRSDAGAVALQCLTAAPNSPTTAAALDVFHGAVAALLSVRPVLDECSAILYILSSLQARANFETALFDSRALQTMSRAFTAVFDVVQGWVLPSRAYASQQTHDGATTLRKAAQTGGAAAQAVTGATKDRVVQFDRVMDNVGRCVKMLHRCALPFQCIMGAFATADYVASATAAAAPDMSHTPTTAAIPPPIESPPERFNSLFKAFDTGPRPEAAAPPSPAFLEPTAMGRRASRLSSRRSSLQLGSLERHEEVRVLLHLTELSIGGGRRFSDSTLAQGGEEWAGRGGGAADERRSAKVGTRGLLSLLRFLVFLDLAADLESRLAVSAGGRRGTVRGADALAAVPLDNARWAFGAVNFLNQDDAARRVLVDAGIVETLCACLDPPAATLLCRDPEAGPAAPDTPEKGRSGSTSRLERRASMLAQPDTAAGRKAEALAGAMVTGAVQTALHEAYAAKVLSVVGGGETSPLLALAMRGSAAGADGYAPPVPAILRAAVSIPLRPLDDASVRRAEGDDGRNPFATVLAPKLALPAKDFVKPALGIMAACARHLFSAGNAMFQAGLDGADGQEGTLVPFARRASTFFALLASVLCRALTPSLRVCAVLCAKEFVSRASVLYSAHGVGTDAGPAAHVATAAPPVLAEKPESLQRVLSEGSVSPVELCDTARELRLPDITIPLPTPTLVRGSVSSSRSGNDDAEHSFGGGIALDGEDAVLQRPTSVVIRRHSLKPDDAPAAEVAFALAGIPGCVPPPPPPKAKEAALRLSSSLDQSPPAVSRSSSQPSLLRKGTAPPQHGPPTPEPTEPGARDSKDEVSFASPFAEIRRVDSLSGLQPRRLSQGTSHGSAAALFSLHDASASGSAAGSTAPSVARVAASRLAVDCVAVEALLAALSDVLDRAQIDVGPLLFSVANPTRRQSVVLSRRPSLGFGARRASAGLSASATAVQEPAVAAMSALTVAALFKLPLAAVVFQPTGGHGGHIIGRGSLVPVLKASLARVAAWEYSALDAATRVAAMVGQAVKQLDDDPNLDKDKDVKDREAPRRSLAPDTPGQDPFAIPRRRSMQGVGFLQAFGRRSSVASVAHASTATVVGSSRRALTSATLSVGFVIAVVADAAEAAAGVAGSEQEVLRNLLEEMRLNYAEDTAVMAAIKSAAQLDGRRRTVHAFRTRDAGGTAGAPQGVLSRQDQQLCAAQYQRLLQVRQDQRQFERDVHAMEGSDAVEDEAVAEKVSAAVAAPLRTFLLSEEESARRAVEGHEEDAAETLRHRFAAGRDAIAAAAAEGERRRAEQSEMRALVEAATAAAAAAAAESIGRQLAEERRVWEEERRAAEAREAERQSAVEAATRRAEAAELDAKAAAVAREAAVAAAHEAARIAREERDAERAAEQQRQQEREAARDAREAERYAAEREAREREARDREAREAAARAREAHERAAREQEWREREARLTKDLDVQASPERPATAPAPPPEQEAAPVVSLASFGLDGGIFSQLASVVLPQRRALLEIEEHDGRRALAAEEAGTRPVLELPGVDAALATPPDPEHLVRHLLAVVEETRAAVRSLERQRSQSLPAPAPAPLEVHRCQSAGPHLTDAQLPAGPGALDPDGDGIADDDGSSVGGSTADHFSPMPQPPAAPQPPPGPEVRYHWGAEQLRPRPPSAGRPSSARRPASRPTSARLALVPRPPPRDHPEERPVTAAGAAVPKEEEEGLTEQLTITALCDDIAAAADGPDPLMDSRGDDRDEATAPLDAAAAGGPPRHTSHFAAPLPGRGRLLAVDLGQHYVGDAGLRAGLGDTLGGLRYLHTLCLPHNGITARGLPLLLEALWGSEHLAVLDLSGNKGITPAAGRPLVKFVQHRPSLRELRVGGTQLFIATRRILDGILTDRCLHSPRPAASD